MCGSAFRHGGTRPWMIGAATATVVVATLFVGTSSPSAQASTSHRSVAGSVLVLRDPWPGEMFFGALVR